MVARRLSVEARLQTQNAGQTALQANDEIEPFAIPLRDANGNLPGVPALPTGATVYPPSGDQSGVTDRTALLGAIAAQTPIYLVPDGEYFSDQKLPASSLIRCVGGSAVVRVTGAGCIIVDDEGPTIWPSAIAGCPVTPIPKTPTNIVWNGQSNMSARPAGSLGYSPITAFRNPSITAWSDVTNSFVEAVDGEANTRAAFGAYGDGSEGPGLGQVGQRVAYAIQQQSGQTIRNFALAYTGQGIDYFLPSSLTHAYYSPGYVPLQNPTYNNYDLLLTMVDAAALTTPIELIVFIQGEANSGETQANYYAKIKELVTAWVADYPQAHVVIVKTLGSSAAYAGVQAAQAQIADENPHVHLVDNQDMYSDLGSAWYGSSNGASHYTNYIGYEVCADRIFATLQGQTWEPLTFVGHADNIFAWDSVFNEHHDTGLDGSEAVWEDYKGLQSLGDYGPTPPGHTKADPNYGGRSSVTMEKAASQGMKAAALTGSGKKWTFFMVLRPSDPTYSVDYIAMLYGTGGIGRLAVYSSTVWGVEVGGGGVNLDPPFLDQVNPSVQRICVFINGDDLTASLYVNGALTSTKSIAGTESPATPELYLSSVLGVGAWWQGSIAHLRINSGHVTSLQDVQDMDAWAVTEFKLA